MRKELTIKEAQEAELKILLDTEKILEKLNLKYSIFYGTLLGAIRHKGFIPWDDDIDIVMPREDYENLIKYSKENNNKISENLFITGIEVNNGIYKYLKVETKEYEVEQDVKCDKYLWIDIFPLDGVPNDRKKAEKYLKKMYIMHHLIAVKNVSLKDILSSKRYSLKNKLIKSLLKLPLVFFNKEKMSLNVIKQSKKYKYKDSKNVACVVSPDSPKQIFKKSDLEIVTIPFEDVNLKSVKGYDECLKIMYGDYMKLPPENERRTHGMKVYKIEKD